MKKKSTKLVSIAIGLCLGLAVTTYAEDVRRNNPKANINAIEREEAETSKVTLPDDIIHINFETESAVIDEITVAEPETEPETVQETEPDMEPKLESIGEYTVTAYCSCDICCGKWAKNRPNGIVYGAAGDELKEGVSAASPLPFGTNVVIDGSDYIIQDRTSDRIAEKYNDRIIDIYFSNHERAKKFGKKTIEVFQKY